MLGNKEIMAKNIQYYMDKYEKSRNDVCNDLGFKYSTFSDWINGKKYLRIDKIEMMANYFHISKSDLVESRFDQSNKSETSSSRILSAAEASLLDNFEKLNETGQAEAQSHMEYLASQDRYRKNDGPSSTRTA